MTERPAKFDSPSDADLISHAADRPAAPAQPDPAPTAAEVDDLAALLATPIVIEEGAAAAPPVPAAANAGPSELIEEAVFAELEDEAIDLAAPAPPSQAQGPAAAKSEDSAIDLTEDAFVFEEDVPAAAVVDDEAIDLSVDSLVRPAAPPKSAHGDDEVIDLTAPGESGIALSANDIVEDLPAARKPAHGGDSAIDLTGGADDGIDLLAEPIAGSASGAHPPVAPSGSGIALVAGDIIEDVPPSSQARKPGGGGDSAIDLTGRADESDDLFGEPAGGSGRGSKAPLSAGSGIVLSTEDVIEDVAAPASSRQAAHRGDSAIDLTGDIRCRH